MSVFCRKGDPQSREGRRWKDAVDDARAVRKRCRLVWKHAACGVVNEVSKVGPGGAGVTLVVRGILSAAGAFVPINGMGLSHEPSELFSFSCHPCAGRGACT